MYKKLVPYDPEEHAGVKFYDVAPPGLEMQRVCYEPAYPALKMLLTELGWERPLTVHICQDELANLVAYEEVGIPVPYAYYAKRSPLVRNPEVARAIAVDFFREMGEDTYYAWAKNIQDQIDRHI